MKRSDERTISGSSVRTPYRCANSTATRASTGRPQQCRTVRQSHCISGAERSVEDCEARGVTTTTQALLQRLVFDGIGHRRRGTRQPAARRFADRYPAPTSLAPPSTPPRTAPSCCRQKSNFSPHVVTLISYCCSLPEITAAYENNNLSAYSAARQTEIPAYTACTHVE